MNPQLSIITINHNNATGLERTIRSIICQDYKDFEYIVVDGASTDGSVEVISKYSENISTRIIEQDHGIYHAMNKGIKSATGAYILFINSGDELTGPEILGKAMSIKKDADIISCNLVLVNSDSTVVKEYPENPTFKYFLVESLPHPATFIRRQLFQLTNGYDERFKICSDWAFWVITLCKFNASYQHIPINLSRFYLDGISSLLSNQALMEQERNQVISENFPRFTDLVDEWKANNQFKILFQQSRLIKIARMLGFLKGK